jgi:hypothetical protein
MPRRVKGFLVRSNQKSECSGSLDVGSFVFNVVAFGENRMQEALKTERLRCQS